MTCNPRNLAAFFSFILAMCCVVAPSHGQEWARKMFEEFSHDFGEVKKGELPEYRFTVKNIYNEDINISRVFSSCGCTQVSVSKRNLKTWETADIVCRFNSKPFDGFKQATVTVQFGPPMTGEVQLTVKGTIVSAINLYPESIDFGQVSRGKTPVFRTTITGPEGVPFRIVDIKSTFAHVGVSLGNPSRVGNRIQYTMQTKLKDSAPEGFSQGELFIVVDDNGRPRQIPLKFNAKMASALKFSPAILTYNNVQPGEELTKRVVLRADEPFKVTDVKCRTKAFRVAESKNDLKKTHVLEVTYTGEDTPGRSETELTFFTSLSKDSSGTIKAIVEVAEPSSESDSVADAN